MNWLINHIYWIFSVVLLIISGVCFFVDNNVIMSLFSYIGFFGCLNLHEISKIENLFAESETNDESEEF